MKKPEFSGFHEYYGRDLRIVLIIVSVIAVVGNLADIFVIISRSPQVVIINIATSLIFITLLILHFRYNVTARTCLAIGVYTLVFNVMISQYMDCNKPDFILYFLRATLFITLFTTIAAICIGKLHTILNVLIYMVFYQYIIYQSHSEFLKNNMVTIFIIFVTFAYVLYYFVNALQNTIRKLHEQNYTIIEQHESLEDAYARMEETQAKLMEQHEELMDVTEELQIKQEQLTERNKQLEELNATKDKFFSIVAHDLKAPIGSLASLSELMIIKFDKMTEERKLINIENILKGTNNLYQLLENLLQWSRSQTNTLQVRPVKVNIENTINTVINITKQAANNKHQTIKTNVENELTALIDEMMLDTVLRNLVSNAIKYTKPNGEVNISATTKNNQAEIIIADNGVGIPPLVINKLFSIANKFSMPGTEGEKGTGLGLIICKEFIEKNNGYIEVESTVDVGTKFKIYLPLA